MTDEYINKFIHAPRVASEENWYFNQLRELIRLFDMDYQLIHNDKRFTRKEFEEAYFTNGTYRTLSEESFQLDRYEGMH